MPDVFTVFLNKDDDDDDDDLDHYLIKLRVRVLQACWECWFIELEAERGGAGT